VTATVSRPSAATSPTGRTPARAPRRGPLRWLREHIVPIAAALAFVYMLLPNVIVVLFSFNDPAGRYNYTWQEFSFDGWLNPCAPTGLCSSLALSLQIGVATTLLSTALGTLAAFAMARHRYRGRSTSNVLVFLPMATPEVVMGSSLLTLFVALQVPLGATTILIAHIMFSISFVIVTVKARIAGLDPRLEQAAMDLYANERQTFLRVTFPLVAPGIVAASLLAFALSFDDYIITNFTASASSVTFPMYVWGTASRGTPVQINVVGTVMFLLALSAVGIGQLLGRRNRKRAAR
jgi:spermidine/putrescine transport system permease protein